MELPTVGDDLVTPVANRIGELALFKGQLSVRFLCFGNLTFNVMQLVVSCAKLLNPLRLLSDEGDHGGYVDVRPGHVGKLGGRRPTCEVRLPFGFQGF